MSQRPPQQLDPIQIRPRTKKEILEHIEEMNRQLAEEAKQQRQ